MAASGDVKVVQTSGFLSDHYNPMTKTLAPLARRLSHASIAAVGVACHEAGHAIQHAQSYAPVWLRFAARAHGQLGSSLATSSWSAG